MNVYVLTLEYFNGDYKRPESSSDILGVKDDELAAYKFVFKAEYRKNVENEHGNWENEKLSKKYADIHEELDTTKEITEDFYERWVTTREKYLGRPDPGVSQSTGYRGFVTEFKVNEESEDEESED